MDKIESLIKQVENVKQELLASLESLCSIEDELRMLKSSDEKAHLEKHVVASAPLPDDFDEADKSLHTFNKEDLPIHEAQVGGETSKGEALEKLFDGDPSEPIRFQKIGVESVPAELNAGTHGVEGRRQNEPGTDRVLEPVSSDPVHFDTQKPKIKDNISLADYYYLKDELYMGQDSFMETDLDLLGNLGDYDKAVEHILSKHSDWHIDDTAVKRLLEILRNFYNGY